MRYSWRILLHSFSRCSVLIVVVIAFFGCSSTFAQKAPQPFVIEKLGKSVIAIDGDWQFHTGDDLTWAFPDFDDSSWQPIQAGRSWEVQGHYDYTGFAWYRRRIVLGSDAARDMQLTLYLRNVEDACEVYWNGALIGGYGKVPPYPRWYFFSPTLNATVELPPSSSGVLALRVWKAPHLYISAAQEGGLEAVPRLGTSEGIEAEVRAAHYRWLQNNLYDLALALVSALIGFLALAAWLRNRERMMLLWLALIMFFPVERLLLHIPGLLNFRLAYAWVGPIITIHAIALWFGLLYLLGLRENRTLLRWTRIISIVDLCLISFDTIFVFTNWTEHYGRLFLIADVVSTIPAEIIELYGLVLVMFALQRRLDGPRWFLAVASILNELVVAMNDYTSLGVRWTHWTFGAKIYAPLFEIAGVPFNMSVIADALLLVAIIVTAWRYLTEWRERQFQIEKEYQSAYELQQVLIPQLLPSLSGYAVTSAYCPAQEVGGDFFQVIPLADRAVLVIVGDVSGKGLRAAMAVSLIVGAVRTLTRTISRPAEMLHALNQELHGRLQGGFATCLILYLDSSGECTVASAGHPATFLNGRELSLSGSMPLGMIELTEYEETALQLKIGDSLLLYTDGLLEARNSSGEILSFDRLASLAAKRPTAADALRCAQSFGQEDDITVLTVMRLAAEVESTTELAAPVLAPA